MHTILSCFENIFDKSTFDWYEELLSEINSGRVGNPA
jgi:hypothetical protein